MVHTHIVPIVTDGNTKKFGLVVGKFFIDEENGKVT